jgi:Mn2+/Fe2+ NRAMP family transporter
MLQYIRHAFRPTHLRAGTTLASRPALLVARGANYTLRCSYLDKLGIQSALIILAIGLNPSRSLVISQVVLSFGIPPALIPLLIHCRNRQVMGALVNRRATTVIATGVVKLSVSLNVFLLYQTFFGC